MHCLKLIFGYCDADVGIEAAIFVWFWINDYDLCRAMTFGSIKKKKRDDRI